MARTPSISIISPNYNKGAFAAACVQSVLEQQLQSWELLMIDDGSTDDSFEQARRAAAGDERCRFLTNDSGRKGANGARNMGIALARAPLILFLDSDDLLTPESLAQRVADFASRTEMEMLIYPTGIFFDRIGDSDLICNIPTEEPFLHRFLKRDITWLISGPTWRKSTLESLGGFDLELQSQQDYDLHVRALIKAVPFTYFHRKPDVYYRRNVDSVPRLTSHTVDHLRQRYAMVRRHHALLREHGQLYPATARLVACYLLDLAQMMRWHKASLGRACRAEALAMWRAALDLGLVSPGQWRLGKRYLYFKHEMLYNRAPALQRSLEAYYRKRLGDLIFYPSTLYCQVTLDDYPH